MPTTNGHTAATNGHAHARDLAAIALAAIREADRDASERHPAGLPTWREAFRATRVRLVAALVGHDVATYSPLEADTLAWLGDQDAATVAGVSALIARARAAGPEDVTAVLHDA
jgi:hypothetical protein